MNQNSIQAMMKQAQKMQAKMLAAQADLEKEIFEGESGGGKVKTRIDGKGDLREIRIDRAVVDPDDVEMLEDLVMAAVSQARATMQRRQQEVMGAFRMPGLPGF